MKVDAQRSIANLGKIKMKWSLRMSLFGMKIPIFARIMTNFDRQCNDKNMMKIDYFD